MEKMNDLKDLLRHEIEDLYSVEEQILEALPAMIDKAKNKTLKKVLSEHLRVTQTQKDRLDKIQQELNPEAEEGNGKKRGLLSGIFSGGKHVCKGMQGILDEGNKMMKEDMTPEVLDAAIIACAQKVEHYEICGYGTARTYARELNMEQVARALEETLNEEYDADDRLTALAVERINLEAGGTGRPEGSSKTRSGREGVRERASRPEMEMEPVSSRNEEKRSAASERGGGKPKASGSPRSAGTGRTAAKKTTATHSRAATKSSARTNGRSSSSGRGGSSPSHSRGR